MPRTQIEKLWCIGAAAVALPRRLHRLLDVHQSAELEHQHGPGRGGDGPTGQPTLQARIKALQSQSKKLGQYQAELTAAQQALPATTGVPDLLRTLQTIGSATQTDVSSFTVGTPTPVVASTTPSPSASASASKAPTGNSASAAPAGPAVYSLGITAQVQGAPANLMAFLAQLQSVQPRAVLISQISQAGASANGSPTASGSAGLQLTMQAFMLPTDGAQSAQAAAAK